MSATELTGWSTVTTEACERKRRESGSERPDVNPNESLDHEEKQAKTKQTQMECDGGARQRHPAAAAAAHNVLVSTNRDSLRRFMAGDEMMLEGGEGSGSVCAG